jgi:hypothetical protein
MTLDTRVYVLDPVPPQAVFAFGRALIGAEDRHTFRETAGCISNNPGQGLPAWLMLYHGDGAPLHTAEQAAAHDGDCNVPGADYYEPTEALCDGTHAYRRACWLTVSFDTAYGYSDDRGYGCGDLHAEYVARLGQWLDSIGVRWEWMNEFTSEVHSGYDRLSDLGRGGASAADWFRSAVLPAIAADMAARQPKAIDAAAVGGEQ